MISLRDMERPSTETNRRCRCEGRGIRYKTRTPRRAASLALPHASCALSTLHSLPWVPFANRRNEAGRLPSSGRITKGNNSQPDLLAADMTCSRFANDSICAAARTAAKCEDWSRVGKGPSVIANVLMFYLAAIRGGRQKTIGATIALIACEENYHVPFLECGLAERRPDGSQLQWPRQRCEPKIRRPLAPITTNNTMTTMHGTAKKIRRIVSMQNKTIANIASFPNSTRTINRITGTGATNIQTPCSRLK